MSVELLTTALYRHPHTQRREDFDRHEILHVFVVHTMNESLDHAASSFLTTSGVADLKNARISFFCPGSMILGLISFIDFLGDFLGDDDGDEVLAVTIGTPIASSSRANSA